MTGFSGYKRSALCVIAMDGTKTFILRLEHPHQFKKLPQGFDSGATYSHDYTHTHLNQSHILSHPQSQSIIETHSLIHTHRQNDKLVPAMDTEEIQK